MLMRDPNVESVKTEWPQKYTLFGSDYSATDYDEASRAILHAAETSRQGLVSCHAVHALVTFSGTEELRQTINQFDMVTPDGQPVRWALNLLHKTGLSDRVYGPSLMLHVCKLAAQKRVPIYLYGGTDSVLPRLESKLKDLHPDLLIAGAESPPFRPLTDDEDDAVVERINRSGARIVFIGLGCPKQDLFAFEHRDSIQSVQICVGAAFDFHAGVKPMAPQWMQRFGLEWLFRLIQEPGRLWHRYLVTNSIFLFKLAKACSPFRSRIANRSRRSAQFIPSEIQ